MLAYILSRTTKIISSLNAFGYMPKQLSFSKQVKNENENENENGKFLPNTNQTDKQTYAHTHPHTHTCK